MSAYDDLDGPNFKQGDCPVCGVATAWDWRDREFFCLQCNWTGSQPEYNNDKANTEKPKSSVA